MNTIGIGELIRRADFSAESSLKERLFGELFNKRTGKVLSFEELELVAAAGDPVSPETLPGQTGLNQPREIFPQDAPPIC